MATTMKTHELSVPSMFPQWRSKGEDARKWDETVGMQAFSTGIKELRRVEKKKYVPVNGDDTKRTCTWVKLMDGGLDY